MSDLFNDPGYQGLLLKVQSIYSAIKDDPAARTYATTHPIETFASFGVTIDSSYLDRDTFESTLGTLWGEAFSTQQASRVEVDGPGCVFCKIAVSVLFLVAVNQALIAVAVPGLRGFQTVINAANTRTRFLRFWQLVKAFVGTVGVPAVLFEFFLNLCNVAEDLNAFIKSTVTSVCELRGTCSDPGYPGHFQFTHGLGWTIHGGTCDVSVGDQHGSLDLAGLRSGASSAFQNYRGSVTQIQSWSFLAYTSGGEDGYTWSGKCQIESVVSAEAERIAVLADARTGTFSVTLSDGRSASGPLQQY